MNPLCGTKSLTRMDRLNVATRNLDTLRIDPAIVLSEQRRDHPADVVGNACPSQRCPFCHPFVYGRIVADNPATKICLRSSRCHNVDSNPTRAKLLRHVLRQHLKRALHRGVDGTARTDHASSCCRYVDDPAAIVDEGKKLLGEEEDAFEVDVVDAVEFFLRRRLKWHVAMTVPRIVHQEIKPRRSQFSESVFHAFDEGAE